MRNKTADF